MTILGRGDLSPRRRTGHPGRWVALAVAVLLVAAAATYAGYRLTRPGRPEPAAAPRPCPSASATTGPVAARDVHLVVDNATLRPGLAARVAHVLRTRGFHVSSVGNAGRTMGGVATVTYPAGQQRAAATVAAQVSGATTASGSGPLRLDLDHDFSGLRSRAQAAAAVRAATPTPSTACDSGSPTPTSTGSPS